MGTSKRTPTVVGITGHQNMTPATKRLVRQALLSRLQSLLPVIGVTSLAAGSDQIFAECVDELGGSIAAIIPSEHYEDSFDTLKARSAFRRLNKKAVESILLPFPRPSEEAYMSAGRAVVDRCQLLVAVWDGLPAGGLGGTADVITYARTQGKPVEIVWPSGSRRALNRPSSTPRTSLSNN